VRGWEDERKEPPGNGTNFSKPTGEGWGVNRSVSPKKGRMQGKTGRKTEGTRRRTLSAVHLLNTSLAKSAKNTQLRILPPESNGTPLGSRGSGTSGCSSALKGREEGSRGRQLERGRNLRYGDVLKDARIPRKKEGRLWKEEAQDGPIAVTSICGLADGTALGGGGRRKFADFRNGRPTGSPNGKKTTRIKS